MSVASDHFRTARVNEFETSVHGI